MTNQEIINGVRDYAEAHYEEDGWDFVVECWEGNEILDICEGATTVEEAIKKAYEICSIMNGQRKDIEAEIF